MLTVSLGADIVVWLGALGRFSVLSVTYRKGNFPGGKPAKELICVGDRPSGAILPRSIPYPMVLEAYHSQLTGLGGMRARCVRGLALPVDRRTTMPR
jgi:hypothetical protein